MANMSGHAAALVLVLLGAGCGDDDAAEDGGGAIADAGEIDAAVADAAVDAGAPDAAADAAPDAAPDPGDAGTAGADRLVVSGFTVAASNRQVLQLAQDIDGDGFAENAVGGLMVTIAGTIGQNPQTLFAQGLASGAIIQLVALEVPAEGPGSLRAFIGDDLDADPGDNFSGEEPFDIAAGTPTDSLLPAQEDSGVVVAGPGEVPLRIPLAAPFPGIVTMRMIGGRVDAQRKGSGGIAGLVGGAFLTADVDAVLLPRVTAGMSSIVAEDCPTGPDSCEKGSTGQILLMLLDIDQDGVITAAELRDEGAFTAVFLEPDLDLLDADGNFNPNQDGVNDSLSWGAGFATVGAAFELP
jgi:hypothetical protein